MNDLGTLQRWMQEVITHPAGINPERAGEMIRPSATLTSVQRLEIYNRSILMRLLDSMEALFPALLHAVGRELFRDFALGYLHAHPPASFSIDRIADAFPKYLAATRPAFETWPDFVIELAELELAYLHVHEGEGVEGENSLALPRTNILALRLVPAPSLRLFACHYPVHRFHAAVRRGEKPEIPAPARSFIAMSRCDWRVQLFELPLAQYAVLKSLDGRRTLAEVLDVPRPAAVLHAWVAEWIRNRYVVAAVNSLAP